MKTRWLSLAVAAPLLTGCASTSAESVWNGTVDTLSTGTIVVRNPAPVPGDTALITPIEDLRIGSLDSDGPDMFGQVYGIEVDAEDNIYILEGQAEEIRVFDESGVHLRTIARKGGGPGEFGNASGMALSPEGELWVMDPGNSRLSVFSLEGELLRSINQPGGWTTFPWPGGFFDDSTLVNAYPHIENEQFRPILVATNLDNEVQDTLPIPTMEEEGEFFELVSENGRMRTSIPQMPYLSWKMDGAGHFWSVMSDEYRLRKTTPDGDTTLVIEMAFERAPMTDSDIDAAIEGLQWFVDQGGRIDRNRFPDLKLAIGSFIVSPEGYVLVRPILEHEEEENRTLDAFGPDGRFMGRLKFAYPVTLAYAKIVRNRLYSVVFDDLGVPYVVRFRLAGWPGSGSDSGGG